MYARMRKKKMRNFILKPFRDFCENLHQRKFPAIRYVVLALCLHYDEQERSQGSIYSAPEQKSQFLKLAPKVSK